jgi:heme exporter protein C
MEREMGEVQRIFYFHVPSAIISFLAFLVVCIASILFLATGRKRWDILAHSSAEIGVLLCTLVLVSGPIWAKPVWGVWWTWEVRLTTTLILWLVYVAYLMVRSYTENPDQGARFAAVLGIVGFLDVPIIWFSVRLYRGLHPTVLRVQGGGGLDPQMRQVFLFSLFTFFLLFAFLLWLRTRIGHLDWESECLLEEASRVRKAGSNEESRA